MMIGSSVITIERVIVVVVSIWVMMFAKVIIVFSAIISFSLQLHQKHDVSKLGLHILYNL